MLTNDRRADLFDGVEYFFNAIKAKCSSDEEYAAELLKARGFLLEDEGLILSDNSHKDDAVYLNELLTEDNIGEVQGGKIFIFPQGNVEKIFYRNNRIGGEASCYPISWKRFVDDSCAPKVQLRLLEPFVGRYVKAISACGVETWCSCDGNHFRRRRKGQILVDISSEPNVIWHEIIRQRLLVKNFKLKWELVSDSECTKIIFDSFDRKDKWRTYTELNRAAEFLYNNRIKIRQIRREASDGISNAMTIRLPKDELAAIFSERANKLFDEFLNEV